MPHLEKFGQDDDFTLKIETAKFGSRKSFSKAVSCFLTTENAEMIPIGLCPDDRRE